MDGKVIGKYVLGFLVLMLIFSCEKIREKPDNLIDEYLMVDILVDYHLYKESSVIYNYSNIEKTEFEKLNIAIAQKHKVTFADFQASWDYYILQDGKTYAKILEEVETRLVDSVPDLDIDLAEDQAFRGKIEKNPTETLPKKEKEVPQKKGQVIRLDSLKKASIRKEKAKSDGKQIRAVNNTIIHDEAAPIEKQVRPSRDKKKVPLSAGIEE